VKSLWDNPDSWRERSQANSERRRQEVRERLDFRWDCVAFGVGVLMLAIAFLLVTAW
jgi:hypothetical protein